MLLLAESVEEPAHLGVDAEADGGIRLHVPRCATRNATGSSCYIRPAEALGRTSWVLASPLARAGLDRLAAAPGLVVESSPGIFEAWLRLAAPVDATARSAAARLAGGDAGAVPAGSGTPTGRSACGSGT